MPPGRSMKKHEKGPVNESTAAVSKGRYSTRYGPRYRTVPYVYRTVPYRPFPSGTYEDGNHCCHPSLSTVPHHTVSSHQVPSRPALCEGKHGNTLFVFHAAPQPTVFRTIDHAIYRTVPFNRTHPEIRKCNVAVMHRYTHFIRNRTLPFRISFNTVPYTVPPHTAPSRLVLRR